MLYSPNPGCNKQHAKVICTSARPLRWLHSTTSQFETLQSEEQFGAYRLTFHDKSKAQVGCSLNER